MKDNTPLEKGEKRKNLETELTNRHWDKLLPPQLHATLLECTGGKTVSKVLYILNLKLVQDIIMRGLEINT